MHEGMELYDTGHVVAVLATHLHISRLFGVLW
jgi:hypothetical protein